MNSVCVSVCWSVMPKPLEKRTANFACKSIQIISRSSLSINFIWPRLRLEAIFIFRNILI